ncbi:TPR repeat region-containing protein [Mycolicibacterium baixiangningiae]|uniref:TPR repeat region-containing protein n=1 Tax=Mycolicibacterium baixiangningiae TaxID=2761578 RepID=UPI0027DA1770|nr:EspA/EspE family type VII secretion system effector [Mycolicibacterium baixiangningiae]
MSALHGFYTTWDNARQTFGQGAPQPGADFDKSPQLANLGSGVTAAAPGSTWSGAAATNYDKANTDHQKVFTQLAELDRKIAQQVDQSGQVVATGRQNLDQVRQWVTDAANSVPPGKQRDMFLMQIANKGLGQLTEVVQKTNAESNTVAQNLAKLGPEFDALTRDQKFGNGEKDEKGDAEALGSEEEKKAEEEAKKRAEQDVQDALAGDQNAAARVEEVIGGIKPGQDLSPEQGSYLSQMQAQQHGMTVEELKTAEERLGDHRDIIADSWQLMSNDAVHFPKTELEPEALDDPSRAVKGGFDQLPEAVKEAVKSPGVTYAEHMREISSIVRDGDPALQTGTQLDREMLNKADRMMDAPIWEKDPASVNGVEIRDGKDYDVDGNVINRDPYLDAVVSDIFTSAGRDHHAVAALVTGEQGEDFLHDVTHHAWNDKGAAAGSLFSWTGEEAGGPNAQIASDTAEAYAAYIGKYDSELLDLNNRTIGDMNPHLVQGMAVGLTPYISDIAGLSEGQMPGFDALDGGDSIEKGIMANAKGVFSVIGTDDAASVLFNGAALQEAAHSQQQFAEAFKNNPQDTIAQSRHLTDSATLQGLVDTGMHNALAHEKLNGLQLEQAVYDAKSQAYDMDAAIIGQIAEQFPVAGELAGSAAEIGGPAFKEATIGQPPTDAPTDQNGNYVVPDLATSAVNAQVVGAMVNQGIDVSDLPKTWVVAGDDGQSRVLSFAEVQEMNPDMDYSEYSEQMARAANGAMGEGYAENVNDSVTERYNQVTEILDPQSDQPK